MLAAASTPGSAGSAGRSALPATPVDLHSLPHLPSFSRLARSSSNASVGAGGSPAAAGARGGTTALTPSGGQAQQQHTPLFGSGRTGFSAPRSPGFGSAAAGSGGGIWPRAGSVVAAPGSGAAALDRRLGSSSRRLSAPTGYSESGMSDAPAPSFSLQAPSGLSSDDEDEVDSKAASRRRRSSTGAGAGVRPLAPAELALAEVTARLERQLRVQSQQKVAAFERAMLALEAAEAAALAAVEQQQEEAAAALAAAEAAAEQQRAAQRSQLLTGLRSQHQAKAQEGQRKVQQLEAAVRQQAEAAAAAAAAAAKADQDRRAAAEAAAHTEQQRAAAAAEQAAAADKAAADAAAAKAQQKKAAAAAAAAQASGLRIAPSAAEWEKQCAEALAAAHASVKPFVDDRAMRDKKRSIDKFVTLNVQQISATLEQVRLKANALVQFMGAQHGAQRTYALLTLANKLISQCEVQVTRLHSFAFPLGEVAVAVMASQPDMVPLLAARLHQVCPLTVPKYVVFKSGADEDGYLKQLGYRIRTDEDTGEVTKESTDEFVGRMQGYLMLYAAAMQSDNPQNPHGLGHAWELLARLLNALPANRVTATAVDAVLKVAGYRMHVVYRGQFAKLLQYISDQFLPALATSNDPDARAVYTRIQTYLKTRQFSSPPEGRDMPQFDSSSYDRA
ncbi:hypothetical protein COHA_008755 [Chlorella ohadii]|uniref:mRNA export factor GLE1 n=1 Tax=Chlorella ohadii TaxID=2649997 RepID=A0AAD5DJA8_9CHLO|nr:hypothetical protein COHA_008755 [Chlorella ohadii]